MNDPSTNEHREALIANDHAGLQASEPAELALVAELLADESMWTEPRAGLEDAVVRAIVDGAPHADTAASTSDRAARRAEKPHRRRFTLSAVAVAAAVAIVLGSVVEARRTTSAAFTAQLRATGLAPGARASADITRNNAGFRIVLNARRLPSLPAGDYYQAWLKNARGTLVPIGTFSSSDGRVTLWSGVSPKDFSGISVTVESTDNQQTSSGRRVLSGVLRAG